eukprot:1453811-Prymnesium_polylepis.1
MGRTGPIGICTKFKTRGVTSIFYQTLLVNELLTTWARHGLHTSMMHTVYSPSGQGIRAGLSRWDTEPSSVP